MTDRLERLLRPRSIAVIGGGAWCDAVVAQNEQLGYDGDIWPVHPTREKVGGKPAFATIEQLPSAPDAAFVGINRHATIEAVGALRNAGAGGAVCFASGFRETADGTGLQARLLEAAGAMTVLGPNCYGFVNYLDRALLWPDQHGGAPVDGGVAIVAQSSNIAINVTMQRRGLPLAYVVTIGNQAQTGLAEAGATLLCDERVTALGLHIEGIDDPRAFERLARTAHEVGKPVAVLKVGRTEAGRAAAHTHTAALTGTDAGARALFRRLSFAQLDTLPQWLETLKLLHVTGPLDGDGIASMSCSGGEAGLIADTAQRFGLSFPALSATRRRHLDELLGPLVSPTNPLDYHTRIWRDGAALTDTFATMMAPSLALTMAVVDFPRTDRCDATDWETVIDASVAAKARAGGRLAVVSSLPENLPETVCERLIASDIAPLCGLDEACAATAAAMQAGSYRASDPIALGRRARFSVTLSEAEAKAALADHGLTVPRFARADGAQAAAEAAGEIGFPVALKGEGFPHKSENGAVRLNLASQATVRDAAAAMPTRHFLVEEMIVDSVAELLVGVVHDEAHGFVLTLASGGVFSELVEDRQSLLVPADRAMIEHALGNLRLAAMLDGYRGRPKPDRAAIIEAILALQDYVLHHTDSVQAVEINPLLCAPSRAVAADALIIRKADHD